MIKEKFRKLTLKEKATLFGQASNKIEKKNISIKQKARLTGNVADQIEKSRVSNKPKSLAELKMKIFKKIRRR